MAIESVSEEVISEAAAACARHLAKMFGSEEDAIKALTEDPVTFAQIAMQSHMESARKMAVSAHMNQRAFAIEVLDQVR